jgi:hypothetical protein
MGAHVCVCAHLCTCILCNAEEGVSDVKFCSPATVKHVNDYSHRNHCCHVSYTQDSIQPVIIFTET